MGGKVIVPILLLSERCYWFEFCVDFKRLNDGDLGPNTGGMGCYTPVPWLPNNAREQVEEQVVRPLLKELKKRDIDYCGCLYVGLMWSDDGFAVVEFNVRLGDPEAQVLAAHDDRDWLALMANAMDIPVAECVLAVATKPVSHTKKSVVITMASVGYPYGGEEKAAATLSPDLFDLENLKAFAASVSTSNNEICTGKGRVLSVLGTGDTFSSARQKAYSTVEEISNSWTGAQWRKDIALRVSEEQL